MNENISGGNTAITGGGGSGNYLKKMKATLHIPTEQYGFAEVEIEVNSVTEAVEAYRSAQRAALPQNGLEKKAFDAFLDRYLLGDKNHVEDYERMNDEQKMIVQTIKRSLARIRSREDKTNDKTNE